jgi:hypothetical protein
MEVAVDGARLWSGGVGLGQRRPAKDYAITDRRQIGKVPVAEPEH